MGETFLDKAYDRGTSDTRSLYAAWAATYDQEISENGYATPARTAKALRKFSRDPAAPILDFGCGTGLSGLALRMEGFSTIDGLDVTPQMLELAREKSVYRDLTLSDPDKPLTIATGAYAAITAIGVIGVGAAPITVFDSIMRSLGKGGLFAFSFNDHALAKPEFETKVSEWVDCGAARLLFREYGDHLPKAGIKSNVYVVEKAA